MHSTFLEIAQYILFSCCSSMFQVGQSWSVRAPVRRALIPARRSNTSDGRDINSGVGRGNSLPSDDRIHNALLEELCADFGVTDSSDIDFLTFDIPTDRVQGAGQLPADLEELGEIVSFGTVKPKTESVYSVSRGGVRQPSSSAGHPGLLGPAVTTVRATSEIPDDVASPTISSSCEESKPADGGGEGLSEFPPNVHSTTGCASVKPDIDTSGSTEDNLKLKQPSDKTESVVEASLKPPSTQVTEEQGCSEAASHSSNQLDSNSSEASSPKHVAKKARVISSGGDLLEDVKKSYAFVCGADMFTPPAQSSLSHPRLHTPLGSRFDGRENPLQYGMQNSGVGQPLLPDKSYGTVHVNYAGTTTPVKGFRQNYYNEWQTLPASHTERLYHPNVMHHAYAVGSSTVDNRPDGGQFMRGHYSGTYTVPDVRGVGSVPYTGQAQYPRTAYFPAHVDQNTLGFQSPNFSPRRAVDQSARSHGYPLSSYSRSYQLASRQPGPQQNEFYYSPHASANHSLPLHTSDSHFQRGPITADDARNIYPSGHVHPNDHTQPANVNNAVYNDQGDRSLTSSPVRFHGRSVTPGFVPNYPLQSDSARECDVDNRQRVHHAAGRATEFDLERSSTLSEIRDSENFPGRVLKQNEFAYSQMSTGGDVCAERRSNFPRSPAVDRSVVNPMTPHSAVVLPDAEQSYGASGSVPTGQPLSNSGHSFVRHLIGSGSGPYRSHPLFPLLRDLVIADMNFDSPSFPYPLIAGLPKSFDRLISNYFSCTSHNAGNNAGVDPSVDLIVMDALRYAHSALLGNCVVHLVKFTCF